MSEEKKIQIKYTVPVSVDRGNFEGNVVITINSNDPSLKTIFDGKDVLIAECVDKLVYKVFEDTFD